MEVKLSMNDRESIDFFFTMLDTESLPAFLIDQDGLLIQYNQFAAKLYKLQSSKSNNFFTWCKKNSLTSPIKKREMMNGSDICRIVYYAHYNTHIYWTNVIDFYQNKMLLLGGISPLKKLLLNKFFAAKYENSVTENYAKTIEIEVTGNSANETSTTIESIDNIKFHLESIIDQLPVSIYWKSIDNVYVRGNRMAAELAGLEDGKDLRGIRDEDFAKKFQWPDKVVQHFTRQNLKVLSGTPIVNEEDIPFRISSGKTIHQITNRIPLIGKNKSINGILGVSVDITEKVMMTNELIKKNKELNSILDMHKQFLSNQEHDIRTPNIAIISAATAILGDQESELAEDHRIMIQGIVDSAQSLLDYNDSLLNALCLLDPEKPSSELRFSLPMIVERVFNMNKVTANNKGIDYILFIDEKIPPYLIGDEIRLQNILLNLVSNACRFTSQGYIKLSVQQVKQNDNHVYLRFAVEDTGTGIPKEKQLEIYQPFYKLEPSNKGGDRGRGLGLSLVKRYVEEMNGELALSSIVGSGSEFRVVIPFRVSLDQSVSRYDS